MRKLLIVIASVLGVGLVWRALSNRSLLPCPWWLSVLVENPVMDSVASADLLLGRVGVERGWNVLDVGCGPGRVAVAAGERVGPEGRVIALDVQARMIEATRRRAEARGVETVETLLAGAGTGALDRHLRATAGEGGSGGPGTFHAAFLVTVLGEIPHRHAALAEIHRALAPGGVLSVTELLPDPHFQSRRRVRRLAAATGFEVGELFGYRGAYTLHLVKPGA